MQGNGCRKCVNRHMRTQEEFVAECTAKHNGKYDYTKTKFVKTGQKVIITCPEHGDFEQAAADHLRGFGCCDCAGRGFINTQKFIVKAQKIHGELYNYDKTRYVNNSTKVTVTCPQHGDFYPIPNDHLSKESGCRECADSIMTQDYFLHKANLMHGATYDYSKAVYAGASNKVTIICKKHGEFEQAAGLHMYGSGCQKCAGLVSKVETKLVNHFSEFDPIRNDRKALCGKEVDLLFAEQKLGIEVNGIYFHSEAKGKHKTFHLDKTTAALEKGIKLLHFWDYEINDSFDIVTSMIFNRLGESARLYARNLQVIIPTKDQTTKFMDKNHLQGSRGHSVAYGLQKSDGEIVSIMTFGRPRFSKDFEYEILRSACLLGTTVVGGASKLFKHFLKTNNPRSVVTYADRRYSEGAVYNSLGFEFSHDSAPNYFYHKGKYMIPRYSAQKHKLPKLLGDSFDITLSEVDNMTKAGYSRVFDCGNKVFVWNAA